MNGKKAEGSRTPSRFQSTVKSYHDVAASKEAYRAGESLERMTGEGPLPALFRRERDWLVDTAREQGRHYVTTRMSSLAAAAQEVAEVLHSSAQRLSSEEDVTAAHYFDLAADGVDMVASALMNPDFEMLASRTRDFARTHPVLFLGGMASAGFMTSRFLKSSPEEIREESGDGRAAAKIERLGGEA